MQILFLPSLISPSFLWSSHSAIFLFQDYAEITYFRYLFLIKQGERAVKDGEMLEISERKNFLANF